jgi:hypothetical protein
MWVSPSSPGLCYLETERQRYRDDRELQKASTRTTPHGGKLFTTYLCTNEKTPVVSRGLSSVGQKPGHRALSSFSRHDLQCRVD